MADLEDNGVLREWAQMSGFLREVPLTVRKGLFLETVNLTCIDAVAEYLAVGTNIGVVYWYERSTNNMQRLRPEKNTFKITAVKLVSSVDYMVAAGDESGTVTVFRIPKPTPDWVGPAYKQHSSNNVERYTVGGLHSTPVTALEWSVNGQKLFSGDSTGLVVYTEIDFYMNLSKACEILNEKYRIVQLSFSQHEQALVVATEYRCIVAQWKNGEGSDSSSGWAVVQVGQQERRSLCRVGATLFAAPHRPLERLVYSARAGLRVWQADLLGSVQKTIIFKDAIKRPHQKIQLLNGSPGDVSWEGELGRMLVWRGTYLISYNASSLVVLDPRDSTVVASLCGLHSLTSLAVTQTEIFLITGIRNICRLSYTPDPFAATQEDSGISLKELKVTPVADSLLDFTTKLKNSASQFVKNHPGSAVSGSVEEDVSPGTEALELDLPPVVPVSDSVKELAVQCDPRIQILHEIGKQSFDDILFSSTRNVKRKDHKSIKNLSSPNKTGMESSSDTLSVKSCESVDGDTSSRPPSRNNNHLSPTSPPRDNGQSVNSVPQAESITNTIPPSTLTLDLISSTNRLSGVIPPDILPDLRSPDSILKDVHDKEILVAKAFNLEEVLLVDEKNIKEENNQKVSDDSLPNSEHKDESIGYGPPSGSSSAIPSLEPANPAAVQELRLKTQRSLQLMGEENGIDHPLAQEACHPAAVGVSGVSAEESVLCVEQDEGWCRVDTPESAQYVSVNMDCVCMSGPSRTIHSRPLTDTEWRRLPFRAVHLVLSPTSQLVWKLDFGVASALTDVETFGLQGSSWATAGREVESVALTDDCAWYVSAGKVYLQTELNCGRPYREACPVPCPTLVLKVCCAQSMVWVMTVDYWVLWRAGITESCVEGTHWQRVSTPSMMQVADIALGPYNLGWLTDRSNSIYFSDNYTAEDCSWWQVLLRNYLFENSSVCQITSNENSVWVTDRISPFMYVNSSSVKGHRWIDFSIKNLTAPLRWRQITAEGVFEEKGLLWLLSSSNDLFYIRPDSDNVNVAALPCRAEDVSGVSAAPLALWLLTHSGQIHVRQGMGDQCPEGDRWRTLNLEQINDKQVTLCHVSCGCDVIWACDTKGDVYMAVGSPYQIATDTFSPAWVQVEGRPLVNNYFVKVFVGSQTHVVWALDNRNNVYVRSGIFHDFQLGTDWVPVPGLQATQLTISGSLVWALTTTGLVFCRIGISENNYIGNYWHQVPGSLYHLTASVSEGLWGVQDKSGDLVMYASLTVPLSKQVRAERAAAAAAASEDDWEVL